MPAAGPYMRPRFPQAQLPFTNGTIAAPATSRNAPAATKPISSEPQTPSSIPQPTFAQVTVVPAAQLPPTTTPQASIPRYESSDDVILKGYCTEPGYTILDGPTVLWVPVVGCISSKAECCPTPTAEESVATPTQSKAENKEDNNQRPNAGGGAGRAAFPISALPAQGELKGCPKDYHTVTASSGTACCPSSYWLWSTQLGGQIPCYSSLDKAMVPPPIPDTLVNMDQMTSTGNLGGISSGSITAAPTPRPNVVPGSQKPTSAIVNIAYAMQYNLAPPDDEPVLKKGGKIGVGVGAAAGGFLILVIVAFLVRRCMARKRSKNGGYLEPSSSQRFSSGVDMSRVAHEPAGVARTHGGVRYTGVSTRAASH